jgi:3-hydroxyisobutyrate dehydrogenase-like beta-hydroxyacid dehydrogenase
MRNFSLPVNFHCESEDYMRVGFIGLGKMGAPIAANFKAAGHEVRVWNRTKGKAPEGTEDCASPREAAAEAEVVCTMLADDAAVEAVLDGIASGLKVGAIHCSMSTISVALCRKLRAVHEANGQRFVAAPVFGRPDAAAQKKLFIVTAGAGVEECRPLFEATSQGVYPLGDDPAHAALLKLCGNFFIAMLIEGFGEALALSEKAGVAPSLVAEVLSKIIFGGAPIPTGYGTRIAQGSFTPGFAMPLGLKDVSLALAAAKELDVPLPLADLIKNHLIASLAQGRGSWDWGGFSQILRDQAGLGPRGG